MLLDGLEQFVAVYIRDALFVIADEHFAEALVLLAVRAFWIEEVLAQQPEQGPEAVLFA